MVKELKMGIKVEREHKDTYEYLNRYLKAKGKLPAQKKFYEAIAKSHIKEDKKYYSKLKKLKL